LLPLIWSACKQEEAVRLYKEEVYPDMIGRHKMDRTERISGAAVTYNARYAANIDKPFREAFGTDGSKLDARYSWRRAQFVICSG
jgi:hypothetical protein